MAIERADWYKKLNIDERRAYDNTVRPLPHMTDDELVDDLIQWALDPYIVFDVETPELQKRIYDAFSSELKARLGKGKCR